MKSVLINPYTQTVATVEIDEQAEGLEQYYRLIGCEYVEHVALTDKDGLFIDEEGMLKTEICNPRNPDECIPQAYFMLGNGVVIAGIALVVAGDDEGNTVESELGEEFFKQLFVGGHWIWLDSPEQAMNVVAATQRATAAAYEAKGYKVEQLGDFGLFITEPEA